MKTVLTPAHHKRIKRVGAHVARIEPYGAEVVIFTSMSDLIGHVEGVFRISVLTEEDVPPGVYGLAFTAPTDLGVVFCIAFNADKYREEVIWHEALHTTVDVLNGHGVLFTPDNHEPFAYTQGYLVSQIRQKVYKLPGFSHDD